MIPSITLPGLSTYLHENDLAIIVIGCLLITLLVKEFASSRKNSFFQRLSIALNIVLIPFIILFIEIVLRKILDSII